METNKSPITIVVSHYLGNCDWVPILKDSLTSNINKIVLYTKKDAPGEYCTKDFDDIFLVENVGRNMSDISEFIYRNYNLLTGRVLFLKSNAFSREPAHCLISDVVEACDNNKNVALVNPQLKTKLPYSCFDSYDGIYQEINNNWIGRVGLRTRYVYSFDNFMHILFSNYSSLLFIKFPPGGNFLIGADKIKAQPIYIYKFLYEFVSYQEETMELMVIERALYLIWMGKLIAREEHEIENLIKSNKKKPTMCAYLKYRLTTLTMRFVYLLKGRT